MSAVFLATAIILLATIIIGLVYLDRAPGRGDAMLAALLFGTTGVAMVLVLGRALDLPAAIDVALTFALLAAVLGITFVLRSWSEEGRRR